MLNFTQELKAKPWIFRDPIQQLDNENKSFLEFLNSYLLLSRDIEGYVRTLKLVNEKMVPFCAEYSDWIESILNENAKRMVNSKPCPEQYLNPECKKEPTSESLRSLNYDIIRELKMLETLLNLMGLPSFELIGESSNSQYQYLVKKLNRFKNAQGQLDNSVWAVSLTIDIENGITEYQRLLADVRSYVNSSIRLLQRVTVKETSDIELGKKRLRQEEALEAIEQLREAEEQRRQELAVERELKVRAAQELLRKKIQLAEIERKRQEEEKKLIQRAEMLEAAKMRAAREEEIERELKEEREKLHRLYPDVGGGADLESGVSAPPERSIVTKSSFLLNEAAAPDPAPSTPPTLEPDF